jgi:hypothetical protein
MSSPPILCLLSYADFDLGCRLWCFSTSFGQGGFSDRHEFPT